MFSSIWLSCLTIIQKWKVKKDYVGISQDDHGVGGMNHRRKRKKKHYANTDS